MRCLRRWQREQRAGTCGMQLVFRGPHKRCTEDQLYHMRSRQLQLSASHFLVSEVPGKLFFNSRKRAVHLPPRFGGRAGICPVHQVPSRLLKQRVGLYDVFVVRARHDQHRCSHRLRRVPRGNLQRAAICPRLPRLQTQHL